MISFMVQKYKYVIIHCSKMKVYIVKFHLMVKNKEKLLKEFLNISINEHKIETYCNTSSISKLKNYVNYAII